MYIVCEQVNGFELKKGTLKLNAETTVELIDEKNRYTGEKLAIELLSDLFDQVYKTLLDRMSTEQAQDFAKEIVENMIGDSYEI